MLKKEIIWRYILYEAIAKQQLSFTQKEVAALFNISTSTVFNALKAPRKLNAVQVTGRFFRLIDAEKLLLLWATQRNLTKDVIYSTYVDCPALQIEGLMPPEVIFAAFSAYRFTYNDAPAEYDQVYVYSEDASELKKRFVLNKKFSPNLFVLKADRYLKNFGNVTSPVQTFVDLWNIPKWYAKDFLDALKEKLDL